jgi:SAM-dependent methyltransferases related to tRNA (uracil-5-)-methyltransferase
LSPDGIEAILEMAPQRVVYVSCDPATLARDIKLLTAGGYTMSEARAFDMFPRCAHVETVVLLVKEGAI